MIKRIYISFGIFAGKNTKETSKIVVRYSKDNNLIGYEAYIPTFSQELAEKIILEEETVKARAEIDGNKEEDILFDFVFPKERKVMQVLGENPVLISPFSEDEVCEFWAHYQGVLKKLRKK